ncbi:Aldo/keto reductase, partial [Sodiomyces alkalinus F11]
PPLSTVIPPLILGTATFNTQYHPSPDLDLSLPILRHALARGIRAIDTSPYYGPSERLIGAALRTLSSEQSPSSPPRLPPRESLFLITKAGRIGPSTFDYSPAHIAHSVRRSCARLGTPYLDLVHCHDVEFVPATAVVSAVRELRRLRDSENLVRYIGISGYPLPVLAHLADLILRETGEPIDAVQSYSHFCLQNDRLAHHDVLRRFRDARVAVVTNASMLSMGLLTSRGADAGPQATWHPAPRPLRIACRDLADLASAEGEKLEDVALRWAMAAWARRGAEFGSSAPPLPSGRRRVGVSVMGVTKPSELEETCRAWEDVIRDLDLRGDNSNNNNNNNNDDDDNNHPITPDSAFLSPEDAAVLARADKMRRLADDQMRPALGEWHNYSWESSPPGFVNERRAFGVLPEDRD